MLMHQQLTKYHIQINSLKEKISLLKKFISTDHNFNRNQQQVDQTTLSRLQEFAQYYKDQIAQMKQQIQTLNRNN